jgi:alcohol dehydrogenase
MAFAALASGICLAHAGLRVVHGLAAPIGARLPVPHGVACGTVLAPASAANIRALRDRLPSSPALARYARAGRVLLDRSDLDDGLAQEGLVRLLDGWSDRLGLPGLGAYGLDADTIGWIVENARAGSTRSNPVVLTDEELTAILAAAR